jgi:hypothetical protein
MNELVLLKYFKMLSVNHLRLISLSQKKSKEFAPPANELHTTLLLPPFSSAPATHLRQQPQRGKTCTLPLPSHSVPQIAVRRRTSPHSKAFANCRSRHAAFSLLLFFPPLSLLPATTVAVADIVAAVTVLIAVAIAVMTAVNLAATNVKTFATPTDASTAAIVAAFSDAAFS